ncbi:hypothetical protein V8C37DRAFT_108162 [Trichoderma ceciliae]
MLISRHGQTRANSTKTTTILSSRYVRGHIRQGSVLHTCTYLRAEKKTGSARGGSPRPASTASSQRSRIWPCHACCHCPFLSICHSSLSTQVSSWAPRNYVMHRGWPRLSLDSDHSEGVLRTLISFFFLCVICILFRTCVPSLCVLCPRHFKAPPRSPLQPAIRLLPVPHPGRWSFARPRVSTLSTISVYARMSECSVPRRVRMVFGNHAPKKHMTRRHRAPAGPPLMPNLGFCLGRLVSSRASPVPSSTSPAGLLKLDLHNVADLLQNCPMLLLLRLQPPPPFIEP